MASPSYKILQKVSPLQRKLFDNNVGIMGVPVAIGYFKVSEDDFGDEELTIIDKKEIDVIFNFPAEIPLDRYRINSKSDTSVDESNTFFFEVLPIECYTKFSDNVERGDLLLFTLTDDQSNDIKILLRISETFGGGKVSLVWKKQYCAPYSGIVPQAVKDQIGLV